MRESVIEHDSMKYAERMGWWEVKLMKCSKNGMPDRLLMRNGRVIFIEFKRPGEEPDKQQRKRHAEIRAHKIEVYVVDRVDDAVEILR